MRPRREQRPTQLIGCRRLLPAFAAKLVGSHLIQTFRMLVTRLRRGPDGHIARAIHLASLRCRERKISYGPTRTPGSAMLIGAADCSHGTVHSPWRCNCLST